MSESESEFPNDSEDERAGKEEEESTLAARDSWIGLANSTSHHRWMDASEGGNLHRVCEREAEWR